MYWTLILNREYEYTVVLLDYILHGNLISSYSDF